MAFGCPVRPADNGHSGLEAEDLLALLVQQGGFATDFDVAARAGFLGQLDELLGVLRCIKQGAELLHSLASHDCVGVPLRRFIPFAGREL